MSTRNMKLLVVNLVNITFYMEATCATQKPAKKENIFRSL